MRRTPMRVRKYANEIKVRLGRDHARLLSPAEVAELQSHIARIRDGALMKPIRLKAQQ